MNATAHRVESGHEFPEETLVVTEDRQWWLHTDCDIPHGAYSGNRGGMKYRQTASTRVIK